MTLQADKLAKKYNISQKEAEALVSSGFESPAKIKKAKKSELPDVGKKIKDDRYKGK
jgi:hypothetical protein